MARLQWVDHVKGIGIALMVYAHNFPIAEYYIYIFHMPLFFFVAGMFHAKRFDKHAILKRAKRILVPYFLWSLLLYLFWIVVGRNYGDSVSMGLSPWKNALGILYAQGDNAYMNWGIPMWFLPSLFVTFLVFGTIKKLKSKTRLLPLLVICIVLGFVYNHYFSFRLPWSIDVSLVSLVFYASGYYLKPYLIDKKYRIPIIFYVLVIAAHFGLAFFNTTKVDMYRAIYGNPLLFIINGLSGTLFIIAIAKSLKLPRVLSFLGQHTLTILAVHGRVLTVIKAIALLLGFTLVLNTEMKKLGFTILQLVLTVPVILIVKKYIPLLDGKTKN